MIIKEETSKWGKIYSVFMIEATILKELQKQSLKSNNSFQCMKKLGQQIWSMKIRQEYYHWKIKNLYLVWNVERII